MELMPIGGEVYDDKDSVEDMVIVVDIHIHHSYYYYYSMMKMKKMNLKIHMKKHASSS
jgi:hypothetical protein